MDSLTLASANVAPSTQNRNDPADAPPTPTRVVSFEPGLDWHDDTPSGVQK